MKTLLLIFGVLVFSQAAFSANLRPFQTDYCTNFPNGTAANKELWKECCVQHDLYLWAGGTKDERLAVDRQLKRCVLSKGAPVPAWVMYLGVRIGSQSPIRYKEKEWGNAWNLGEKDPHARYQALSREEVQLLENELMLHPSGDLSVDLLNSFFKDLQGRLQDSTL
jgi:hypothetical protein